METATVNLSSEPPSPVAVSSSVPPPTATTGSSRTPGSCPTCTGGMAAAPPSYVYAIGRIEARFPSLGVEKEFFQVRGRTDTKGMTDQQSIHAVATKREHRYLVRQLCWVLTIQGLDTYLLMPRDPADIDILLDAIRPIPEPSDLDVVIGLRGPIASPEMCNGLMVPIVAFSQIYSFNREALITALPKPDKATAAQFAATAKHLFDRVIQLADNAGATDEHRALNYLVMRYETIYARAVDQHAGNCSLTSVDVQPSRMSGTRKILDVIFSYTNRNNDFTEKAFVRVDVTEEFPFLVTRLAEYYDR